MFTAFFQEERNIGELSVLTELAEERGVDPPAFRCDLETGQHRDRHQQTLRHAQEEMHITPVPTFLYGPERLQCLPFLPQLQAFLTDHEA